MKNVKVNDKTYTAVSTVQLPLADGTGNAQFKDVDEIVEPSGTKSITTNGTHDVADYASVNVNVAGGGDVQDQWVQYCNGEITNIDLTGATKIPKNMFKENTELVGVTMPNVTLIDSYAFNGCSKLALSELPEGITDIKNNTFSNTAVTIERLPSSLRELGNGAFQNCTGVTISETPDKLRIIPNSAFSGCTGISELTLNAVVSDLYKNSFDGCTNLTKVTFKGIPTGQMNANAFSNCNNLKDIYVPWAEGTVANAPWGATNATIHYNSAV